MSLSELTLAIKSSRNVVSFQCQLPERKSVIAALEQELALSLGIPCYLWNLGHGSFQVLGDEPALDFYSTLPFEVLDFLFNYQGNGVFILENLHPFLESSRDVHDRGRLLSQLTNLASEWADTSKYAVLLGTQEIELPPIVGSIIPELWHPLPYYEENVALLEEFLLYLDAEVDLGVIPQLALSAGGLSAEEIKAGLRLVKAKKQPLVQGLLNFKIERLKAFNLAFTPCPNVGNFGGMDRIRSAINGVKEDYTHQARQAGIPLPKGWLLVGPPGTGKTFVSKFCASILEFPMISVDTGAVSAGGASYLRRLLDRVEASAPTVVYFDELDKLFPEAGQPADVAQRQVLGLLLTWLQDKVSHTFVIATLNRLDTLPPELTRLGRFDEIFYVGFPQAGERKDILHLHASRFDDRYRDGNDPMTEKEWRAILNKTINCTGAELSTMVEKAAKKLFRAGQEIRIGLEELLQAREAITPLYIRDTDRILKIENMAKYVAHPCSSPDTSIYAPPLTSFWGQKVEG